MDVTFYISELLFSNDCVIVPGFGGFVTHYAPARIHPINHNFLPPSKNILFNSKLVRDDGLLTDFISSRRQISYAEAKAVVEAYRHEVFQKLAKGDVVHLKNIGNIQKDSLGKLLFTPDESVNYLEDAFGLSGFVSPPVRRQSIQKKMETRFIDRKPVPDQEKRKRKQYLAYAALIPVLFVLGWLIFFSNNPLTNTQQSGMLPLTDSEFHQAPVEKAHPGIKDATNPPLESLDLSGLNEGVAETAEGTSASKREEPLVIRMYYIIGGAFGVEENADNLVAVLRKRGYAAERAGLSPSGLHMVSYFSTEDKSEALINLENIRSQDNPSAWLIRK